MIKVQLLGVMTSGVANNLDPPTIWTPPHTHTPPTHTTVTVLLLAYEAGSIASIIFWTTQNSSRICRNNYRSLAHTSHIVSKHPLFWTNM